MTALVSRVAELGARASIEICDPVKSMHTVALDPTCKQAVPLFDGRRLTAVQIQCEYVDLVEKYLAELPSWAKDVCRCWRNVLTALAEDPMLLSRTLDWPIKYAIFKARADKIDVLVDGRDLLTELHEAAMDTAYRNTSLSLQFLLGPSSPVLRKVAELKTILRRYGLKWTQLKSSSNYRARLSKILDLRFGILGHGLFDELDRRRLLQHRVVDDADIERTMKNAPAGTRAHLRSQIIKELADRRDAVCSWERIVDSDRGVLDLSDPQEQSLRWHGQSEVDLILNRASQRRRERAFRFRSPEDDCVTAEAQVQEQLETST